MQAFASGSCCAGAQAGGVFHTTEWPHAAPRQRPTPGPDHAALRRVEAAVVASGLSCIWISHDPAQPFRVGGKLLELPAGTTVQLPPPAPLVRTRPHACSMFRSQHARTSSYMAHADGGCRRRVPGRHLTAAACTTNAADVTPNGTCSGVTGGLGLGWRAGPSGPRLG